MHSLLGLKISIAILSLTSFSSYGSVSNINYYYTGYNNTGYTYTEYSYTRYYYNGQRESFSLNTIKEKETPKTLAYIQNYIAKNFIQPGILFYIDNIYYFHCNGEYKYWIINRNGQWELFNLNTTKEKETPKTLAYIQNYIAKNFIQPGILFYIDNIYYFHCNGEYKYWIMNRNGQWELFNLNTTKEKETPKNEWEDEWEKETPKNEWEDEWEDEWEKETPTVESKNKDPKEDWEYLALKNLK